MTVYAGHFGPESLEFPDGGHAKNLPVEITSLGGTISIPLYTDPTRAGSVEQPIQTDEYGNLSFYANPGRYLLKIGEWTTKITVAEDPQEPDELSPEDRQAIIDDAADGIMTDLEPPVNLVLLFNNAKT